MFLNGFLMLVASYSNMKIGHIELSDWKYCRYSFVRSGLAWYRGNKNEKQYYFMVVLYDTIDPNTWKLKFFQELNCLNEVIQSSLVIGSASEAKKYVDDFLGKMSRLSAFI